MLAELSVHRIALIEQLRLEFQEGLITFTGETGAGKSILLDAIGLLLGNRASADIIRTGASSGMVEALFIPSQRVRERVERLLASWGIELDGDELIISRELHRSGRSVCRINGRMATVQMLRELGSLLVQQHGQHDQHGLLRADEQRRLLDLFGHHALWLDEVRQAYDTWRRLHEEWRSAQMDERERARRLDMLNFQIEEITAAELKPGEEETLRAERQRLQSAGKIAQWVRTAADRLQGQGNSLGAAELLSTAYEEIAAAKAYDQALDEVAGLIETAQVHAEEAARALHKYLDRLEDDPQRLQAVEDRLALIRSLQRKYGVTVEDVLAHLEAAVSERDRLLHHEEQLSALEERVATAWQAVERCAQALHERRCTAAERLSQQVTAILRALHMPNARFSVAVELRQTADGQLDAGPDGADEVVFYFSANRGEDVRPLQKVASGGELSRTLLALKSVLAEVDDVDTLIFDEIDAGVSGQAALQIASQLRRLGSQRQVLCVTHAAQIAAAAHAHFCIEKVEREQDTATHVRLLTEEGRIREVARLVGADVSDATALQHATAMLRSLAKDDELVAADGSVSNCATPDGTAAGENNLAPDPLTTR